MSCELTAGLFRKAWLGAHVVIVAAGELARAGRGALGGERAEVGEVCTLVREQSPRLAERAFAAEEDVGVVVEDVDEVGPGFGGWGLRCRRTSSCRHGDEEG